MKISTKNIVKQLVTLFPDQTEFKKSIIVSTAENMGFKGSDWYPLCDSANRVKIGTYNLSAMIIPIKDDIMDSNNTQSNSSMSMASIVNEEKYMAKVDSTFVPWGAYTDVVKIIKSEMFYPTYISGLSGNGKTFMVEQAAAKLNREFIRVQINPETDEDDLLGGFRLIDGETVFSKGPVLKAMENGAILLLDEIDRATNKIMCLQGILEGKPVLVKKTGETVTPAPGFNVIATANTTGKGSEDGRFTAATILDDAFLERFTVAINQKFPSVSIEKKIVIKHMEKFGETDAEFADKLVTWADIIRKTFYDDGVDEVISTRRLCHIVQTYSIFGDKLKSLDLCIARFDEDTKAAFLDLYTKVDDGVITQQPTEPSYTEAQF
jgi:midasin (ATPase involved in ribosome maturation)|tara:strand:- start:16672 stop:17808 length:1137 start_codon:yes stop_codon:yes gene_type:complete